MIITGLVLLILGLIFAIPILWTIGVILLIVGLVLMLMSRTRGTFGGRYHYW